MQLNFRFTHSSIILFLVLLQIKVFAAVCPDFNNGPNGFFQRLVSPKHSEHKRSEPINFYNRRDAKGPAQEGDYAYATFADLGKVLVQIVKRTDFPLRHFTFATYEVEVIDPKTKMSAREKRLISYENISRSVAEDVEIAGVRYKNGAPVIGKLLADPSLQPEIKSQAFAAFEKLINYAKSPYAEQHIQPLNHKSHEMKPTEYTQKEIFDLYKNVKQGQAYKIVAPDKSTTQGFYLGIVSDVDGFIRGVDFMNSSGEVVRYAANRTTSGWSVVRVESDLEQVSRQYRINSAVRSSQPPEGLNRQQIAVQKGLGPQVRRELFVQAYLKGDFRGDYQFASYRPKNSSEYDPSVPILITGSKVRFGKRVIVAEVPGGIKNIEISDDVEIRSMSLSDESRRVYQSLVDMRGELPNPPLEFERLDPIPKDATKEHLRTFFQRAYAAELFVGDYEFISYLPNEARMPIEVRVLGMEKSGGVDVLKVQDPEGNLEPYFISSYLELMSARVSFESKARFDKRQAEIEQRRGATFKGLSPIHLDNVILKSPANVDEIPPKYPDLFRRKVGGQLTLAYFHNGIESANYFHKQMKDKLFQNKKITKEEFISISNRMNEIGAIGPDRNYPTPYQTEHYFTANLKYGVIRSDITGMSSTRTFMNDYAQRVATDMRFSEIGLGQLPIQQSLKIPGVTSDGSVSLPGNIQGAHYYPAGKSMDHYFKRGAELLTEIINLKKGSFEGLDKISEFYFVMVHARPYEQINNSLFMIQVNYLLRAHGEKGITHGFLDHLAHRMTLDQFRMVFKKHNLGQIKNPSDYGIREK